MASIGIHAHRNKIKARLDYFADVNIWALTIDNGNRDNLTLFAKSEAKLREMLAALLDTGRWEGELED